MIGSLPLPRVIFGATCLGNMFVAMSERQKRELIAEWFRNMSAPVAIDTAGKYGAGLSLEVLGRELASLQVDPGDVIVSNKLGWRRVPLTTPEPTFEPGVWVDIRHDAVQDISYAGILRCYEEGCGMLGSYRPQLISVHDPDEYLAAALDADDRRRRLDDICEAYRALTELRNAGKAAGVGVGVKDWRVIRDLDRYCDFDWVMMANSFTVMNHPEELVEMMDTLASRGVVIINSALMHGGFLVGGRFLDYRAVDPDDADDARRLRWRKQFTAACEEFGQSPFQVAVAFGISHPAVRSVALSTSRPDRVGQLVSAATDPVPPEVWDALRERGLIDPRYPYLTG